MAGDVSPRPRTFEELGAEDGLVAYEADVSFPADATLTVDGLRDRAVVFLDERRLGVLERDGETSLALPADGGMGRLTILVESLGRINYGPYTGEGKGIMRGVMIGRRLVNGWTHRLVPQEVPALPTDATDATDATDGVAVASLDVDEPLDAWLAFPGGAKGMVWLNGFLLGRYWKVGPQETLYAPAPLWKAGRNEIVVLDTDDLGATVEIRAEPSFGETEEFIGS
ncbi:hypothetical protein [Microbacterium aurugineum]